MGFYDDLVYTILLVISVGCGHYLNNIKNAEQKKHVAAVIGIFMVLFVCKTDIVHSLIVICINSVIIKYVHPRKCHLVSFAWCFGYIVFFRTTHFFGLPKVVPHANAVQLLLTLKMVGVAFEVHDTHNLKESIKRKDPSKRELLQVEYQRVEPTFTDIFLYGYSYIGLLTGPYYKFRTYEDMMYNKHTAHIDTWKPLQLNLQKIPLYVLCYLVGTYYFDVKYAVTEEFYGRPFLYRIGYAMIMFTIMRVRFYIAWVLSECICMTACLGAYPVESKPRCGVGPTDLEKLQESEKMAPDAVRYDFKTIHNIDEYRCDFDMTVREGMRSWNKSVQYWLAHHVYKRLTLQSSAAKVAVTMLVSAFWHGIHPGYYLSFLTIPLCLLAEDLLIARFYKPASGSTQRLIGWLIWFVKMRNFDYMAMGFLLLTFEDTIGYWSSIYFACHVWTLLFILIGYLYKPKKRQQELEKSKTELQTNDVKKVS